MGRVCGMDGGGERSLEGFVMEPEGNTQFGIFGIGGLTIMKFISKV